MNIYRIVEEIRQKISNGEGIGPEELQALQDAAKRSGRLDHRALYASVKDTVTDSRRDESAPIDEARLQRLESHVTALAEKAKRTGSAKDRTAYVNARNNLEVEREIFAAANNDN